MPLCLHGRHLATAAAAVATAEGVLLPELVQTIPREGHLLRHAKAAVVVVVVVVVVDAAVATTVTAAAVAAVLFQCQYCDQGYVLQG